MMLRILWIFIFVLVGTVRVYCDDFDVIKKRLRDANCTSIEFLSILSSKVFESTDSIKGTAIISKDGRYYIEVGQDIYINDGNKIYSYSPSTNQVIIQKLDSGVTSSSDISFITKLDDWFKSTCIKSNQKYNLIKLPNSPSVNIPDSMVLSLDSKAQKIKKLEYLDINDEPVTIIIINEKHDIKCDENRFLPKFPDSAERIKL